VDHPGIIVLCVIGLILLICIVMFLQYLNLYIQAFVSGAHVGFSDLIGMRLRKVSPLAIVNARIQAMRAGLQMSLPAATSSASSAQ
jgi:uncharacterized protein YqfA (UPF0365 family)